MTDANQDGLPDVYFIDGSIGYGLRGGGYANTQMHFTSDTSKVYNYTKATGDSNFSFPSVKDGMFVGLNEPTNHMIDAYDMSRTGAKDFFSEQGELAYNIGDNNYYTVKAPGRFTPCDINNDGETDFVVSKKGQVELWIYREGGTYEAKQLVANEALSKSYCRDFDHDGDADILVAFDYKYGSPNTFLVFFRNNGDGTFRKKENAFEAQYEFGECVDAFNDGNYQIIARTSANTFLIDLNADFTACESFKMEQSSGGTYSDSFLGDIDRDGNNEILVDGRLLYRAVGANPNSAKDVFAFGHYPKRAAGKHFLGSRT